MKTNSIIQRKAFLLKLKEFTILYVMPAIPIILIGLFIYLLYLYKRDNKPVFEDFPSVFSAIFTGIGVFGAAYAMTYAMRQYNHMKKEAEAQKQNNETQRRKDADLLGVLRRQLMTNRQSTCAMTMDSIYDRWNSAEMLKCRHICVSMHNDPGAPRSLGDHCAVDFIATFFAHVYTLLDREFIEEIVFFTHYYREIEIYWYVLGSPIPAHTSKASRLYSFSKLRDRLRNGKELIAPALEYMKLDPLRRDKPRLFYNKDGIPEYNITLEDIKSEHLLLNLLLNIKLGESCKWDLL